MYTYTYITVTVLVCSFCTSFHVRGLNIGGTHGAPNIDGINISLCIQVYL